MLLLCILQWFFVADNPPPVNTELFIVCEDRPALAILLADKYDAIGWKVKFYDGTEVYYPLGTIKCWSIYCN